MSKVASRPPHRRKSKPQPEVRTAVRHLLMQSAAFVQLSRRAQTRIVQDTVLVSDYLVQPPHDLVDARRNLIERVDFPAFVASLIKGVFQAIVDSSIEQMEAYGKLIADVAKSVNTFSDQNLSESQARDYLVAHFPDLFQTDNGKKKPAKAVIRRLATKRQQLLATMVLMGINRIVRH